jgi:hypothetical protein
MLIPHKKYTYFPPRPVSGIALLFIYIYDIPTSQEAHVWASTACYRYIFTFLHVNDARTSQQTPLGLHGLLRG